MRGNAPKRTQRVRSKSARQKGRGTEMSWVDSDYVKLLLWRPEAGPDRWLIALRTTADYYGWTKNFEVWSPKPIGTSGGYQLFADPGRKGKMYCEGGRRHRISRDPSRRGHTPGTVSYTHLTLPTIYSV